MSAWPQYAMAGTIGLILIVHLVQDGARQTTSAKVTGVIASLLVAGFYTFILWAGGFWAPIGWPS